ncbi:hypothetical protein [Halomicrobium katesii]|uniref:hypothetical protein n=1 Tax=Halomicrobium katesii TaxID=437163 RepID=UPI0003810B46|nr:hypothetical protein [Halomicrobium katesii]
MLRIEENHLPESWTEGEMSAHYWIVSRFTGIVVAVGIFYMGVVVLPSHVPGLTPMNTGNQLRLTGIWSSIVLTFALFTVYKDMAETQENQVAELREERELQDELGDIQDRQTEIMDQQQKLMEKEHQPLLEVVGAETYDAFVAYKLRNIGRGPATDLKLRVHIKVPGENVSFATGPDTLTHIEQLGDIEPPESMAQFSNSEMSEISSLTDGQTGVMTAEVYTYGPNRTLELPPNSRARGIDGLIRNHLQDDVEIIYQEEVIFDHLLTTIGKGRLYLHPRTFQADGDTPVSNLLDREESSKMNMRRAVNVGFETPSLKFDE